MVVYGSEWLQTVTDRIPKAIERQTRCRVWVLGRKLIIGCKEHSRAARMIVAPKQAPSKKTSFFYRMLFFSATASVANGRRNENTIILHDRWMSMGCVVLFTRLLNRLACAMPLQAPWAHSKSHSFRWLTVSTGWFVCFVLLLRFDKKISDFFVSFNHKVLR